MRSLLKKQLLCGLVVLMSTSAAFAQDDDALARAVEADRAGKALFADGDYDGAARAFRRGFRAHPIAPLLKSEIVAWSKAGRCDEAESLLEEHAQLAESLPASDVRDLGRIRTDCAISRSEDELAAGRLDAANESLESATKHDVEGRKTAEIEALRVRIEERREPAPDVPPPMAESPPPPAESPPLPPAESPRTMRPIVGWSLVGAGLLTAASVPVFLTPGYKADLELNDAIAASCAGSDPCPVDDPEAARARYQRLNRRYIAQFPLLIGGGVLAAVGVTVLLTGKERELVLRVNPSGLAVSGRW